MFRSTVTIALLLTVQAAAAAADAPTKVYIIAGQSNAIGGAWPPMPPAPYDQTQRSHYNYLIDAGSWGVVDAPRWDNVRSLWSSYAYLAYGVELTFAAERERRTSEPIAVIKVGKNGAGLDASWKPSADDFYPIAVEKIKDALASFDRPYKLAGLLWIHGETDSGLTYWANHYKENLTELVSQLREDLAAPRLPVALNLLHAETRTAAVDIGRQQQLEFVASDPYAKYFDPSDLPLRSDGLHYEAEGFWEMGLRFADLLEPSADFDLDEATTAEDLKRWIIAGHDRDWADANHDGTSDGVDFLAWQRQFGSAAPEDSPADFDADGVITGVDLNHWIRANLTAAFGDANDDGRTDGEDFLIWQRQFADVPAPPAAPVPEPSELTLAALAALTVAVAARRR